MCLAKKDDFYFRDNCSKLYSTNELFHCCDSKLRVGEAEIKHQNPLHNSIVAATTQWHRHSGTILLTYLLTNGNVKNDCYK